MSMKGKLGLKGKLSVKVIRAKPTLRQRITDYIEGLLRRS